MARTYDPYATLEQPAATPVRFGDVNQRIQRQLAAGGPGSMRGRADTTIETDPNAFLEKRLGNRLTDLFKPDQGTLEAIRQRYASEGGARSRAAQLALQSRGGDIPGAYGVTSTLGELGAQSDLSQELGAANLAETQRARAYQESYANRIQDFLQQLYAGYLGENYGLTLQREANKAQKPRGHGMSVGVGGVTVGFARGGIVLRPTHAVLGENGPEAVIPLGRNGDLSPLDQFREQNLGHGVALGQAGDYLSRMQPGPMQPYAPGPAQDGNADTLPLPPAPYREPEPYKPHGVLERIGELSRLIHLELGDHAPGVLKALALGAGGLAAVGEHRLKAREEERGRASEYVKKLNEGQSERYKKQLEVAGRAPIEMIQLPDGTWVKKYSPPGTAEIVRRNPNLRPPKEPKPPKSEAEIGRFVNDTVDRIDRAKSEDELSAIAVSAKGTTVSPAQHARIAAAVAAARARIAQGGY